MHCVGHVRYIFFGQLCIQGGVTSRRQSTDFLLVKIIDLSAQFLTLQVKDSMRTCFIVSQGQWLQTASVMFMMDFSTKNFRNGGVLSDQNNLSLKVNTDGVPIFKSSGYSMWPIYFEINELPPRKRLVYDKTTMVCFKTWLCLYDCLIFILFLLRVTVEQ